MRVAHPEKTEDSKTLLFVVLFYQTAVILSFFFLHELAAAGLIIALTLPLLLFLPFETWIGLFIFSTFVFLKFKSRQISDFAAILMVAVFIGWHISSADDDRFRIQASPMSFAIVFFLLTVGISLIDAAHKFIAIKQYARYLFIFVVYWVLHSYFVNTQRFITWLRLYVYFTILGSITMIVELMISGKLRAFGLSGSPFNDMLVAGCIIAFIFLIFDEQGRFKWSLVNLFLLVSLLIIQTRAAWLSFVLTTSFLSFFLLIKQREVFLPVFNRRIVPIFVGLSLVVLAFLATNPEVYTGITQRVEQLVETSEAETKLNSLFTRALIWDTAIGVFKANPINGVGIDLFPFVSEKYYNCHPILYRVFVEDLDPHLLLLTFLCETGVIGTIGFIVFLFRMMQISLRNCRLSTRREDKVVSYSLLGFAFFVCVCSLYAGSWFYNQNSYELMFFLALITAFYFSKIRNQRN